MKKLKDFKELVESRGAIKLPLRKYIRDNEYEIKTKYGKLWLKIDLEGSIDSIFMRFADKDFNLAKFITETGATEINPYSYKWNIHSSDAEYTYRT